MTYQVTARKWRPRTFDDVVEQEHVTRTLKNAIRLGRVAHAYLFAGTRGVGKTTMARVLAKALNCEQGPTTEPCAVCPSCVEITQGASMDIIEIDGASNRGIDEIRDLRETLRYLPARGRYKVYIIDEVHMLTKEAFNALLKTLEEPPRHVVFIFATTEIEKIPYTILSRCQRFTFKRVSLTGIVSQLERIVQSEGLMVSPASLLRIAKAAEGSMRDAQSLLDQVVAYSGVQVSDDDVSRLLGHVNRETLCQCLAALLQQDAETALRTADALQHEGHEAAGIVQALLEGLRHLIVLKTTAQPGELMPLAEADVAVLRPLADLATVEEIYGHFQVLSAAEQSLRVASNAFMVLEMALVRMARIGHVASLQTLLDTLQRLESGDAALSLEPALPTLGARSQEEAPPPLGVPISDGPSAMQKTQPVRVTRQELAAASPGDSTPAAGDFWAALQEHVAKRRPSVAAFLQPGRIMHHDAHKLVIGFAKADSFCQTSLLERENLSLVREAVEAVGGQPLQVEIVGLESYTHNGTEVVQSETVQRTEALAEVQKQKKEIIQAVLDIFDGTVIT
jgi:DNA polymerase-3 subunit gamma/tau